MPIEWFRLERLPRLRCPREAIPALLAPYDGAGGGDGGCAVIVASSADAWSSSRPPGVVELVGAPTQPPLLKVEVAATAVVGRAPRVPLLGLELVASFEAKAEVESLYAPSAAAAAAAAVAAAAAAAPAAAAAATDFAPSRRTASAGTVM